MQLAARAAVACALLPLLLAGCSSRAPRGPTRGLSPDSAATLRAAIRLVRPAYATQEEALRAGVYAAPTLAVAPPPAATPPPPAPAAPPAAPPARREPAPLPPPPPVSTAAEFLVQIAAFRDSASAAISAGEARAAFPDLRAEIRAEPPLFRVALGGWPDSLAAESALQRIRAVYPSAWLRRPVP